MRWNDRGFAPKNRMRSRASHPGPHCSWIPALPLSPQCGAMTASARQHPKAAPYRPRPVADSSSRDHESTTAAVARSVSRSEEQDGEEAATPGQPVALSRVSGSFSPRPFSFKNRRLPLALPQSSGKLRNSHVSLNPLLSRLSRRATQKPSSLVKKLWTTRLPCGSPRKTKNEYFQNDSPRPPFQ